MVAPGAGDSAKRTPSYRPLGAFRLFLALVVVVGHSQFLLGHQIDFLRRTDAGSLAVFGFFALSGLVIAEANDTFYAGRTGAFFVNRGLRILPPYYAALLLSIAVHLALSSTVGVRTYDAVEPTGIYAASNVTGNFLVMLIWNGLNEIGLSPDYYFVRYIWAVIVELKFYLVAGLVYFVWHARPRRIGRYLVASALVGLLLLHVASLFVRWNLLAEFQFVPLFVLGVSWYHLLVGGTRWWLAALAAALPLSAVVVQRYVARAEPASDAFAVLVAFAALCAAIAVLSTTRVAPRTVAADRWFGDLTYPRCLNHYAMVVLFATIFPGSGLFGMAACVLASVLLSIGVSRATDPPTKRLRDTVRGAALARTGTADRFDGSSSTNTSGAGDADGRFNTHEGMSAT